MFVLALAYILCSMVKLWVFLRLSAFLLRELSDPASPLWRDIYFLRRQIGEWFL